MITILESSIIFYESTYLYFQEPIDNFDISKIITNCSENLTKYFQILFSYSYDKINYADFKLKSEFVAPDNLSIPVYISIFFRKNDSTDLQKVLNLYQEKNVKSEQNLIKIDSISYNSIDFLLTSEDIVKFESVYKLIEQFPRWNFYDDKLISINRWLEQCNAIAEMYGHTCIYFKTEPVETEISHTFKNNVFRNVKNIKKLHVLSPNNELPQDRNIYSEWDMPLQDDFVLHIVVDKFEQAFGINEIPNEKDYLYLPILNKLFRVSASQPKNGFMGKIGWWEVYLAKFEEDETITIDEQLKASMEDYDIFDEALQSIDNFDNTVSTNLFNELNEYKTDTLYTSEKIAEITTDEKKIVTENFSNKLQDSTHYISLKETENQREFYNNRLNIILVNPDTSAFPINMYDNTTVDKRVIAMQYVLTDYTIKNKLSININNSFILDYNFVLLKNFSGELFDLISDTGNLSLYTIKINRNKLEIIDNRFSESFVINFDLKINEIYNISINYSIKIKQFSIKIFSLKNKEKFLEFQNIYIITNAQTIPFKIKYIHLFGGNFYSNEITFGIDDKIILKDYVNPLLKMKQF